MKELFLLDYRIENEILKKLNNLGVDYIFTNSNENLYSEINGHPDILASKIENNIVIEEKNFENISKKIIKNNKYNKNINLFRGNTVLKSKYPLDIAYNFIVTTEYLIGKIEFIDEKLKKLALEKNLTFINVNQGYARCNTLVLNNNTFVTGDKSIYKTLNGYKKNKIKVYYVNDKDIILSKRYKGFIGGASINLRDNLIGFYGTLEKMSFSKELKEILKKEHMEYINLSNEKLRDFGGFLKIV